MAGPLEGVKVVELAGIGPTPFCAMMLADMGAQVLRIERPQARGGVERGGHRFDVLLRGRDRMLLNLREPTATCVVLELLKSADVLLEGYRPGVMERLGLGPDACLARRPSLVYARMTGWGQTGPLSAAAGHDINYIAISGALHAIGRRGQAPVAPPGFIGDMGGGGMMMAFGIACGILAARRTGTGQVIDAAISDGAALLGSALFGMHAGGRWSAERGKNVVDGGAHFYDSYCCADGKYVSVGALEPQFYALLLERCGITDPEFQNQMDAATWPRLKERMAALFSTRSREQWSELLEGTDVCFAPVLDWEEAPLHPHNRARGTFVEVAGVCQPAPAPRFSSTPAAHPSASPEEPSDPRAALLAWGLDTAAVDRCLEAL